MGLLVFAGTGPSPPSSASEEVILAAIGDLTLGQHVEEYLGERGARGDPDPLGYPFARIASQLRAADIVLANLEGPFTARGRRLPKRFNFRASPRMVEVLGRAGITVVTLANNHTMDFGPAGLRDTLAALEGAGIASVGAGMDARAARAGTVLERNGIRVGILGYVHLGAGSAEPGVMIATARRPGVAGDLHRLGRVLAMLDENVPRLRTQSDVVVVTFHWGVEGSHYPDEAQQALGRRAIERGAHLVVGHHPHVLQGIEVYRRGLIAYSLGNFVFGGNWNPRDKDSIILRVRLGREGVRDAQAIPVGIGTREAPFQPFELEGTEGARVLDRLRIYSRPFPTIAALRSP